jgi:hypothetical protein
MQKEFKTISHFYTNDKSSYSTTNNFNYSNNDKRNGENNNNNNNDNNTNNNTTNIIHQNNYSYGGDIPDDVILDLGNDENINKIIVILINNIFNRKKLVI